MNAKLLGFHDQMTPMDDTRLKKAPCPSQNEKDQRFVIMPIRTTV